MTEPDRIEAHAEVTTHVADGTARLARQFRRETIEAVLTPWLAQVQELESAAWDCYALGIDDSAAHALDQVGSVLAMPRPDGMLDAAYRKVLKGVVAAHRSTGSGDDLGRVVFAMLDAWPTLTEAFPASAVVRPAPSDVPAEVIAAVLRRAKAAGVALQVFDVGSGNIFRFSSSAEEAIEDSDSGLGDSTGGVHGGELDGVVAA